MKKTLFTFAIVAASGCLLAATLLPVSVGLPGRFVGPTDLAQNEVEQLQITGPSNLDGIRVLGVAHLMGPMKISGYSEIDSLHGIGPARIIASTFREATVIGPTSLDNTCVTGLLDVTGALTIKTSRLETVAVTAERVVIEASRTGSVLVRKNETGRGKPQRVMLRGNAYVEGDITFESGAGEVHLSHGAELTGRVIGGELIEL